MTARLASVKNKFTNILNVITETTSKTELPERFKGTIIEKWAKYWKQLGIDYRDVAIDLAKDIREKPLKATIYGTLIGSAYICSKKNPTEEEFINKIKYCNGEMMLVHESNLRRDAVDHLKFIEQCSNQGVLKYFSIGIASIIWVDNYDDNCAIYKATCPHLQVEYMKFYERIIDIGFWNKFWKLEEKLVDYDINY